MTQQRKIISDVICSSMKHMTAEQIYCEAKKICPSIALATVYRNLGLMADSGEIMRISIPGEPDIYDRNVAPHDHARCAVCGKVIDVFVPELLDIMRKKTGYDIISYDLSLCFICPECKPGLND